MNTPDEQYVFHGSHELFGTVVPKRQVRSHRGSDGKDVIDFDEVSFHATPYRWIALAYAYDAKPHEIDGKTAHYNMGVSLFENEERVVILGFESLEKSLAQLYGGGGYVYVYEKEKFFHAKGLGQLEMITRDNLEPVRVERIDDPVTEMKQLGVTFHFRDLGKPENEKWRNYY